MSAGSASFTRATSVAGGSVTARSACATCASACTPASVRPEPYVSTSRREPTTSRSAALELALHGARVLLNLPAAVARAGVFDRQLVAGHAAHPAIRISPCSSGASSSRSSRRPAISSAAPAAGEAHRHRSQSRRRPVHHGAPPPKARGSRTSPRRTSTPISSPAAASWRRARARRCILSDEGGADWKYGFAGDAQRAARQARRIGSRSATCAIDVVHTPGHTPEHLTFLVTDRAAAERADRARRPATSSSSATSAGPICSSAPRTSRGRWRRARGRCIASLQAFRRRGRTGCRSGRATAPDPRAARASARSRRARSATSSASTGRSRRRPKTSSSTSVLAGQPEPPKYFAEMKRMNKEGPRVARRFPTLAAARRAAMLPELPREGALVVDTRRAADFAVGHVPGTINIPLNATFTTWAGWLLPYDRGSVSHRRRRRPDRRPGRGRRGVRDLAMIGLDRVAGLLRHVRAIDAWAAGAAGRSATIPQLEAADLAESLRHGGVTLVDVRNADECEAGPHRRRAAHPARLPHGRAASVCRARSRSSCSVRPGGRSAIAASVLRARGIDRVINLTGGISAWSQGRTPGGDALMAKDRTTPEAAAAQFGVGKIQRHMFVCTGPDCATPEQAMATWDYVKRRMKELNITGPDGPAYRTKVQVLSHLRRRADLRRLSGRRVVSTTSRRRTPNGSFRST